jgi:hypothetical protein
MPGTSQPSPEGEFPETVNGSLTASEIAALVAADRAEDDWWPPLGDEMPPGEPVDGPGLTASGIVDGMGSADGELLDERGRADAGRVDGSGVDEEWADGFAEGGVWDTAPPSVLLASEAGRAYQVRGELDDDQLAGAVRVYRRLAAQAQARELALVAELARRRPQPGTPAAVGGQLPERVSEFLADEVAALLTLTSRAAQAEVGLALGLATRWRTAAALEAGRIDMPKALVLLELLDPADEVAAAAIEAAVLPVAATLTTGQLRAWVLRLILDLDPAAARRRREQAVRQAHVDCWTDPDGTAALAGRSLPPAQVLAADRRLCAIATAWKKLGAHGGMDLLRAHAYLALLLGHDTSTPPPALLIPPPDSGMAEEPESDLVQGGAPDADAIRDRISAPDSALGQDSAAVSGRDSDQVPAVAGARTVGGAGGSWPPPLWLTGTVNITVPLATLLGLADRAAEADGFGPLHADTARELATSMSAHPATRWNVIITDPTGRAMGFGGPARGRRITKVTARGDPSRLGLARGSPADELAQGSPAPFGAGGWTITVATRPIAPYH